MSARPSDEHADFGDLPETVRRRHERLLQAEDDPVVEPFTMTRRTKRGRDCVDDSPLLAKLEHGRIRRLQEHGDSKRAHDRLRG